MPEFTARGAGLSVPYLDGEAMAEAFARIAREPALAAGLAATARREVATHHLPQHTAPRILEVLARASAPALRR